MSGNNISIFGKSFWDLWLQKIFRNFASLKFQMLILLYIPVVYGMFTGEWVNHQWVGKIPASVGLAFLGGGYVTLALGRVYAQTRLQDPGDDEEPKILDTNK
jgi:hypothetical protein